MSDLAESIKEASQSKGRGASVEEDLREAAEKEAETELAAALESKDPKRIRAALRAVRDLDD